MLFDFISRFWLVNPAIEFFAPGGGSSRRYQIPNSVRLRASASAYFSRTPGSAGDRKKWTWAGWVKRGALGGVRCPLLDIGTASSDTTTFSMGFWNTGTNDTFFVGGGSTNWRISNAQYRDPTGHYHVVVAVDTANASADDRIKVWINGSQITSWATNNAIGPSADTAVNQSGVAHYIGRRDGGSDYADGVLSDVHFVGGQALSASDFGETNAAGVWVPKPYGGTYAGTNSFHLDFADAAVTSGSNAGLGKDVSGNGNYWNTNSISVTAGVTYDALTDTPTNNYASWNAVDTGGPTVSNGGLTATEAGTGTVAILATQAIDGKVYAEFTVSTLGGILGVRLGQRDDGGSARSYNYCLNGSGSYSNGEANVPDAYNGTVYTAVVANDVVMMAADKTNGKLWFGINGTWVGSGDPENGTNPTLTPPTTDIWRYVFHRNSATGGVVHANFGQRPFAYTPPTGFLALCTANMPAAAVRKPSDAFKVTLATEDNIYADVASARSGWADYVDVLKNRAAAESWAWQFSHDSSNEYAVAATSLVRQAKRAMSGSNSWMGWSIRIGAPYGTAAGSTSHTNGAATTVTHNIGVSARQMILLFNRAGGSSVPVHHADAASGELLDLCTNGGDAASTAITGVTSTAFQIGSGVATGTYDYLVLSELSGFFALGKYTATGSGADQPYSWSGHRPEALIVKVISAADSWVLVDAARSIYNMTTAKLNLDTNTAEGAMGSGGLDILASGHKVRTPADGIGSAQTIVYASFAKHPFGGSNVAPAPAR